MNLDAALVPGFRFPLNVFRGQWGGYLFFDGDLIFDAQFVKAVRTLLEIENAECACLRILDPSYDSVGHKWTSPEDFFLNKGISGDNYMSFLRPVPGVGWLVAMFGRLGCTSDVGSWCIYWERNNEIAVIAVREARKLNQVKAVLENNAAPIKQALEEPPSWGLTSRGMPPEWRAKLQQEYANAEEHST
ncbi:MAG: hypothetical protein JO009_08445 [Candidatus Eremiobacteraeota bacterium]|nr:hypothetical protein [Candidatus Eremiobacteraeota bacterium]